MQSMRPTLSPEDSCKLAEEMFQRQDRILSLWQTLADNFYPERADFRYGKNLAGSEIADATVDSHPIMARRDLGNSFHSMLRDGDWFNIRAGANSEPDRDGRQWLEWATRVQRNVMNERTSNFERAVKIGDHDFATFGNAVLSLEPNKQFNGVVYRAWHLRDCAWEEDEAGLVETVVRKWEPTLHVLVRYFGEDKLTPELRTKYQKDPFQTTKVYHLVMPSELTNDEKYIDRYKFVSKFIMMDGKEILEEKGINYSYYIVPRFQTIAGSPYAFSPATITALPDARTLQSMTYTLLEAAERYARPPMVATMKAVTGVVDLRPNGITWVDNEYDERLGQALRSLDQNKGGYPIGANERSRIYETIEKAFYLSTLSLPLEGEMTAYEVKERMQQYRRSNLPLFAPMERDYNGQLCEATFDLLLMMGQLGSPQDIPESLGGNVEFKYESPLSSDEEEEKMYQFARIRGELREAADMDAGILDNLDFDLAIRDAIVGMDAPVQWIRPQEEIAQIREARLLQQAAAQATEMEAAGAPA